MKNPNSLSKNGETQNQTEMACKDKKNQEKKHFIELSMSKNALIWCKSI